MFCLLTDPHTDGRQTPAGPVHHIEEEETCHRDEVFFCSKTNTDIQIQSEFTEIMFVVDEAEDPLDKERIVLE